MPIYHKIANVPDSLCRQCPQQWDNDCRAFQVPHSDLEEQQRKANPRMLCQEGNPLEIGQQHARVRHWQE